MKFSERLKEFFLYAKQNDLLNETSKVVVALSGGADSMVLLHFLYCLQAEKKIAALHAFHLNHSLRGEADSEERFVVEYCSERNIPVTTVKEDVRGYALSEKISEETAGRELRYRHLRKLKDDCGYDVIATAHHADDNAETILMRLTRGTGLRGMGGIHPKSDDIIRPILYLTKSEIYDICESENIPFVTDKSNFDNKYFRNRVRNTVIPSLAEENPSFSLTLLRTSEIMRDAWDYISFHVDRIPVEYDGKICSCDLSDIEGEDSFIVSQLVFKMCGMMTNADNVGYSHAKKITQLLSGEDKRWEYHLPGIKVVCGDGKLTMVSGSEVSSGSSVEKYFYEIIIGEKLVIDGADLAISTKIIKKNENFIINSYIKAVDYDKIKGKLFITPREDNMKFRPVGRNMTKSVSKFLSDKKIPMAERNSVPVFRDDEGIVSVGCIEIDERVRITNDTKNILLIIITKIQGENNDDNQ
ncbi:MAG: tRNA lysidine(34) synthetase TilS [Eubacteriaceae bacterium]|nr:tRNA lysidine(34) synthetase TilS [Eubacteriaceae bacterium]